MIPNLQPIDLLAGREADAAVENGTAVRLAGGWIAFSAIEVAGGGGQPISIADLAHARSDADDDAPLRDQMARLTAERPAVAGLDLTQPRIMGIVNVTPDSFSDGGRYLDAKSAIDHGMALLAAGADILDVGGESTRPDAGPVSPEDEIARVTPVIEGLRAAGAPISIDTRNAATMRAAVDAGAQIVNDVSALGHDPESRTTVAALDVPVILMHMRGTPDTMRAAARYDDVVRDVVGDLAASIAAAQDAGVQAERILVDPGFGFAKKAEHNAQILHDLALLHGFSVPLVVGASRKLFDRGPTRDMPPHQRVEASVAAAMDAVRKGAQIVRVHDVAETRAAIDAWLREIA